MKQALLLPHMNYENESYNFRPGQTEPAVSVSQARLYIFIFNIQW